MACKTNLRSFCWDGGGSTLLLPSPLELPPPKLDPSKEPQKWLKSILLCCYRKTLKAITKRGWYSNTGRWGLWPLTTSALLLPSIADSAVYSQRVQYTWLLYTQQSDHASPVLWYQTERQRGSELSYNFAPGERSLLGNDPTAFVWTLCLKKSMLTKNQPQMKYLSFDSTPIQRDLEYQYSLV